MIAVIDYGAGNIRSVYKALKHIGCDCVITRDKNEILNLPNKYETLKTGISDRISDKKKKVPEYINMELNNRVSSTFEYNRLGQEIRYNKIISESKKQRKKK